MLLQNEKMMNFLFQSCISWLRWNKALDPAADFFCRLDWSESVPVRSGLEKEKNQKEIKKSKKY